VDEVQDVDGVRVGDGDDFERWAFGLENFQENFLTCSGEGLRSNRKFIYFRFLIWFICVHTNRANPLRDCRLINQIPKGICRVFNESRQVNSTFLVSF
jgi:hypothetical protein